MVIHPKFDMQLMLESVSKYRIERLYLVRLVLALFLISLTHLPDSSDYSSSGSQHVPV